MSPAFEQAMAEFFAEQERLSKHPPLQYRAYYDGTVPVRVVAGPPFIEMNLPWIVLTEQEASVCSFATHQVVDGRLVKLDNSMPHMLKLIESDTGEYQTVHDYMSLVLQPGEEYEQTKQYTVGGHS